MRPCGSWSAYVGSGGAAFEYFRCGLFSLACILAGFDSSSVAVLLGCPALCRLTLPRSGSRLPDRWAKTHPEQVLLPRLEESRAVVDKRRQRRAARRLLTQV